MRNINCVGRDGTSFINTNMIARSEADGVGAQVLSNYLESDHRVVVDMILDDPKFKGFKIDEVRKKTSKPYKQEDLNFSNYL